ncbi:ABC transporter permease [Geothermobacter ehrlichii]|nr:ABC transporter permease [Geothermobacter ehrlichii]
MLKEIIKITLKGAVRDRVLHSLLVTALLMVLLTPVLSLFSMRQVRELSITLSLSMMSFVLLILATLMGASAIWRDVEKRYTATLLGLPLPRAIYLCGRFVGLALFLLMTGVLLGSMVCMVVAICRGEMSSALNFSWFNLLIAITGDVLKYILLAAVAFVFSALSTSFFLPIFGTIAVYLAGTASQEVLEYLATEAGRQLPALLRVATQFFCYLLPNFAVFDFKVQAIYGLTIPVKGLLYAAIYFVVYTGILLVLAVKVFDRRELQ